MFSKLTVPFIGDQESYFADAKKITERRKTSLNLESLLEELMMKEE